jgi:saccharopine dehydrogenase-like NADP-dependent oxidoreductase
MKEILLLGMGKVGSLVGLLLSKNFKVTAFDQNLPHYNYTFPFPCHQADVTNLDWLKKELPKYDAVVSALPYFFNKKYSATRTRSSCSLF